MLSALTLALLTLASADTVPASIRACTAETDHDQRLACFDREIARYPAPGGGKVAAPLPVTPATSSATRPQPTAASPAAGPTTQQPVRPTSSTAHILSIDHIPNQMVLHLDNGQTWQQQQSLAGDLSLKIGDTVKIEHHLGSDWLSGPHVSNMKVRQAP